MICEFNLQSFHFSRPGDIFGQYWEVPVSKMNNSSDSIFCYVVEVNFCFISNIRTWVELESNVEPNLEINIDFRQFIGSKILLCFLFRSYPTITNRLFPRFTCKRNLWRKTDLLLSAMTLEISLQQSSWRSLPLILLSL